jgi:hypothetical protein
LNPAEQLIAEAAKSPEHEAWISRQILAGQRPSQILATLGRAVDPAALLRQAGGDGPVGLTVACVIMFALPFFALGFLLPT